MSLTYYSGKLSYSHLNYTDIISFDISVITEILDHVSIRKFQIRCIILVNTNPKDLGMSTSDVVKTILILSKTFFMTKLALCPSHSFILFTQLVM